MALRLTARLEQRMVLTPQLRQRIEMLQMTSLELTDLVQTELLSNPILEEVQSQDEVMEISEEYLDQYAAGDASDNTNGSGSGEMPDINTADQIEAQLGSANGSGDLETLNGNELGKLNGFEAEGEFGSEGDGEGGFQEENPTEQRDAFEEVDYGREFQDYLDPGYKTQEIEYKEDEPSFDQFLSRAPSLGEHLEWQLNLQCSDDRLRDIAIAVIGNLDRDGRFTATSEEIAEMENCSVEQVDKAREMVMQFDPVGCGARDVSECLLAQLIAEGEGDSLAAMLVKNYLSDLQPHRLAHLAKNTGYDLETLNDQLKIIRTLDPYPGRRYSSEEAIFVAPEVYVEKLENDDDYVIYFTDDGSPRLRISPTYQQLLEQNGTSKETRDFIKDKVRSAVDLLRNIEHRRQTIYRVVECIIHRQRDFLDKGVEYIKPMMLKDVAEDIGMHLSTISRVVNRKYAHTPQGVIELRRFFSEGMMNEDGEEVSTRIIKLKIKKLIEEEDTKNPITDDEMAKILSKEGIKLSRRTVAKYRDQMQIAGSRERKTVI